MRAMSDAIENYAAADDFVKKLQEQTREKPVNIGYETRTQRRARERAEAKAAKRAKKQLPA